VTVANAATEATLNKARSETEETVFIFKTQLVLFEAQSEAEETASESKVKHDITRCRGVAREYHGSPSRDQQFT
jgi:hypothetical protein